MNDTELVVVGTCLNQIDADLAKGALEAADIDAMLSADDAGGQRPHRFAPKTPTQPPRSCAWQNSRRAGGDPPRQ